MKNKEVLLIFVVLELSTSVFEGKFCGIAGFWTCQLEFLKEVSHYSFVLDGWIDR